MPQMTSSEPSHRSAHVGTAALTNPIDTEEVDLLDTRHWTVKDWEAATLLAEHLMLQNALKRAAEGASDHGPIQGM
jgi:hypothetical protein